MDPPIHGAALDAVGPLPELALPMGKRVKYADAVESLVNKRGFEDRVFGAKGKVLGSRSPNSYARYEQGRSVPSVGKFAKLFAAVAPNREFVIMESRVPYRRLPARS